MRLVYIPDESVIRDFSIEDIEKAYNRYLKDGTLSDEFLFLFWYVVAVGSSFSSRFVRTEVERLKNFLASLPKKERIEKAREIIRVILGDDIGSFDSSFVKIKVSRLALIGFTRLPLSSKIVKNMAILHINKLPGLATQVYRLYILTMVEVNKSLIFSMTPDSVKEFAKVKLKVEAKQIYNYPPCIQRIMEGVEEGYRNNSLFALISFFKYMRDRYGVEFSDEFIEKTVREVNERFDPPLPENSVDYLITYHLYGHSKFTVYNFCGFIRRAMPEFCEGSPKECWRLMFRKPRKRVKRS